MVILRWWIFKLLKPIFGFRLYARTRFWHKARRMLGRWRFLRQVTALYYCAIDSQTPRPARVFALVAVAYFLAPIDLMPDGLPGVGLLDDGVVIAAALRALGHYVTAEHHRRAEAWPWAADEG